MDCPACGHSVSEGQQYCDECGKPLQAESVSTVAAKSFSYEITSAVVGLELLVLNLPVLFGIYLLYAVIPDQIIQFIGPTGGLIGFIVLLTGYNVWLYRRKKNDPSFGLFRE